MHFCLLTEECLISLGSLQALSMIFVETLTVPVVRAVRHSLTLQLMGMAFAGRMMEGETSASRPVRRRRIRVGGSTA